MEMDMYLTRKNMEDALIRHLAITKKDEIVSFPFHADNRKFEVVAWIGTGASVAFNYFIDDKSYIDKLKIFDYYLDEAQWMN
jgi:hypothetical protein